MAELYQTTRPNIVQHIRNIYADRELDELATFKIHTIFFQDTVICFEFIIFALRITSASRKGFGISLSNTKPSWKWL